MVFASPSRTTLLKDFISSFTCGGSPGLSGVVDVDNVLMFARKRQSPLCFVLSRDAMLTPQLDYLKEIYPGGWIITICEY